MKIVELINKISIPLTNEEADVLGRFHETPVIERRELNDRECHVANQLVNKDILLRKNQDGKITYKKKVQ
jgi:hypothetical protein